MLLVHLFAEKKSTRVGNICDVMCSESKTVVARVRMRLAAFLLIFAKSINISVHDCSIHIK